MFKKINNSRLESFIGSNSGFRGDIDEKGTLRIDGTFEGNITAEHVIIGEKAYVRGNITAHGVTIGGKFEGNIESKGLVEITPKGFVSGDIIAGKLSIAEGGTYSGRVLMDEENNKSNVVGFQAIEN